MKTLKFNFHISMFVVLIVALCISTIPSQSIYANTKIAPSDEAIENVVIETMKYIDTNKKAKTSIASNLVDEDLSDLIESKRNVYNYMKSENDYSLLNYDISARINESKLIDKYLIKTCYVEKSYNYSDAIEYETKDNSAVYVVIDTTTQDIIDIIDSGNFYDLQVRFSNKEIVENEDIIENVSNERFPNNVNIQKNGGFISLCG